MRAQSSAVQLALLIGIAVAIAFAMYVFTASFLAGIQTQSGSQGALLVSPLVLESSHCEYPNVCVVHVSSEPVLPISAYCEGKSTVRGSAYVFGNVVYLYFPVLLSECKYVHVVARNGDILFCPDVGNLPKPPIRFTNVDENLIATRGADSVELTLAPISGWYWYKVAQSEHLCDSNFQLYFSYVSLTNTSDAGVWLSGIDNNMSVYPPYISAYASNEQSIIGVATKVFSKDHTVAFAIYPSNNSSPASATFSHIYMSCRDPFSDIPSSVKSLVCPCAHGSGFYSLDDMNYNTVYCVSSCIAEDLGSSLELNMERGSSAAFLKLNYPIRSGVWYSVSVDANVMAGRLMVSGYVPISGGSISVFSWCSSPIAPYSGMVRCMFYYPPESVDSNDLVLVFEPYPYRDPITDSNYTVFALRSVNISVVGVRG